MGKFSGLILLFDIACLLVIGIPVYLLAGMPVLLPGIIAFIVTSALAIASFYPFTRMSGGNMNKYLSAMLIGMFIRMIFIGTSVAIVFVFTELHQISFTVALLFSYICKSVIETYILTKKHRGQPSVS
ncbi:hypothetical protein [Natronogracilivirga saccharolytica]|uniref:Uncharacterized protein n=1 Tax=Natronogracilivirga saccharolytica TaxID=2812953 RepID=A0A8J7S8P8_9BACT|nr:hypothetical protein [Natronogracilivirga saccharolytica]MBP3192368.1 hypothetical protein [Natronogracilivirga saccharolytica]